MPGGDRVYRMRDIVAMPAHSLPVLLVCAGNRRKEENMLKQTIGCDALSGAMQPLASARSRV